MFGIKVSEPHILGITPFLCVSCVCVSLSAKIFAVLMLREFINHNQYVLAVFVYGLVVWFRAMVTLVYTIIRPQ